MTYRTEKDDNGDEALYLTAIIHQNIVDLDWAHEEDDAETYSQRWLARFEALVNAGGPSFPPESALLTLRLYRRGDAMVSNVACADAYRGQAIRLAEEAALGIYDEVYPDVAEMAHAFVAENVENVKRLAADGALPLLAAKVGEKLAAEQFLPHLLDSAKSDLQKSGEVVQKIGWLVNKGMVLFPVRIPYEKRRFFRAVAEVARRVNADAVVYVSDGYELNPNGERTGAETLVIMWINPDGTCVSKGVIYTRRKHPQIESDIITFSTDVATTPESKQSLVPAWGSYQPN
jgi:hypothetical protein